MRFVTLCIVVLLRAAVAQGQVALEPLDLSLVPSGETYGDRCGIAGTELDERRTIESLIARRDTATIRVWLHHDEPARRLYGAEAVLRLRAEGVPVCRSLVARVDQLRASNERVHCCHGCTQEMSTFAERMAQAPFVR